MLAFNEIYILAPHPHPLLPLAMKKKRSVIEAFKLGAIGEENDGNQKLRQQ